MTIGYCAQTHVGNQIWYVCDTPHPKETKPAIKFGVDWGWTTKREQAIDLSDYWQLRFAKDMSRANRVAQFVTC